MKQPKTLFLISEDWNVVSHFLPHILSAIDANHKVFVATRVREHKTEIELIGATVIPTELHRQSLGLHDFVADARQIGLILKTLRPNAVYAVSLRNCLIAGIACLGATQNKLILAPTGLGYFWTHCGLRERVGRHLIRLLILAIDYFKSPFYVFENCEDAKELGLGRVNRRIMVIGGSGVKLSEFKFSAEPACDRLRIAFVGRMTVAKGVLDIIAAVRRARELGVPVELHLYGPSDPADFQALSPSTFDCLTENGVTWHGPTDDVEGVWQRNHVAILLSKREGLPRALVEAASVGRPIIATDVVGCREVVENNVNGFLVPVGDVEATAMAIKHLHEDSELRARMGRESRKKVERYFSDDRVKIDLKSLFDSIGVVSPVSS